MTDDDPERDTFLEPDTQVSAAFDELRSSVEAEVDVEASLGRVRAISARGVTVPSPRRGRWATWGAVAAAAVLLAGVIAMWPTADEEVVRAADGTDPDSTTSPMGQPCPGAAFVYMSPGATVDQITAVEAAIADLDGLRSSQFMDTAATYQEFSRLFADDPSFVQSIDPAELPSSFRVSTDTPLGSDVVGQLEQQSGVYRVELEEYCAATGRTVQTSTTTPTTATTTATTTTAG